MRRLFYFLTLGLLVTACQKDLSDGDGKGDPDFIVPENFDWATLQRENVELKVASNVYQVKSNGEKALIGQSLQAGTYSFTVAKGSKLETTPVVAGRGLSRADASKTYFPAQPNGEVTWATMMVEDTYPWNGDMDMNDVVFKFRLEYDMDATDVHNVSTLTIHIQPMALGGKLYDKIGVALQFVGSKNNFLDYATVSGQEGVSSMFPGLTDGKESKVLPLLGNLFDFFDAKTGCINTFSNVKALKASKEIVVTINFDAAARPELSQVQLMIPDSRDQDMIDLFVVFGERGKEVHVKEAPQTAKMTTNKDFNKHPSYSSPENWVWALILPGEFKYPEELHPVYEVFPDFKDWVKGDMTGVDWTADHTGGPVYIPMK